MASLFVQNDAEWYRENWTNGMRIKKYYIYSKHSLSAIRRIAGLFCLYNFTCNIIFFIVYCSA